MRGAWFYTITSIWFSIWLTGCVSSYYKTLGTRPLDALETIYAVKFESTWQAAIEALKRMGEMQYSNKEGGIINTKWIDNTAMRNITDTLDGSAPYLKSKYQLNITISAMQSQTTRVVVFKKQVVMRDVLDGWKTLPTDLVEETTLLYRIQRLIWLTDQLNALDASKARNDVIFPRTLWQNLVLALRRTI